MSYHSLNVQHPFVEITVHFDSYLRYKLLQMGRRGRATLRLKPCPLSSSNTTPKMQPHGRHMFRGIGPLDTGAQSSTTKIAW